MSVANFLGRVLKSVRAHESSLFRYQRGVESENHSIVVTSDAFADGGVIPDKYTKRGGNLFPPLAWRNIPGNTQELVLVAEDSDAPAPDHPFVHVIVWGIPPEVDRLAEGSVVEHTGNALKAAGQFHIGRNTFGKDAWMGPDPISGHGLHHYNFQVFALNQKLEFPGRVTRRRLLRKMRGRVLAVGQITGMYERM